MSVKYKTGDSGGRTLLIPGSVIRSVALKLKQIDVVNRDAADHWIMVFSGTAEPADNSESITTPRLVQAGFVGNALWTDGIIVPAPGIVICLSSTSNLLTKAATAANFEIEAEIEEFDTFLPTDVQSAGDETTDVANQSVWNDASGPKKLFQVLAKNNSGGDLFLQLFADDAPADGAKPLQTWPVLAGETLFKTFGTSGLEPKKSTTAATNDGCLLVWSSTGPTKTAVAASGTIKALYL